MHFAQSIRLAAAALTVIGLAAPAAHNEHADREPACLTPDTNEAAAAARGGATGLDHRDITATEQRAIERRTSRRLAARGVTSRGASTALVATKVPVYVHVMRDRAGHGNVTNHQIARQIAVLNRDYQGSGFSFKLIGADRYNNTAWHHDRQSAHYRTVTRKGGVKALNIWLVDFSYLGIATFPWDYARKGNVDGIRVQFSSLPGGNIIHFNLGGTVSHETGHWFGLFHTFQGGCTSLNDEVSDTPAQASPTSGCPPGRDSCPLNGSDPIHNFMDYSWDSCYTEFTQGQFARMHEMWAAYRA